MQIYERATNHSEKSCLSLKRFLGTELAEAKGCATFFEAAVKKKCVYHDKRDGQNFSLRQFKDFKSNKL